jgi:voltage-gated potassium channel
MEATQREIILAALLLLTLALLGTTGYVVLEDWYWVDGLYMTFITLTTIGFNEVNTLSTPGRFFTIFIGVVGIGIMAFIATRGVQILLTSQLLRQRHLSRMINNLDKHYILCGYGRIGYRIAQDLHRAEKPFVVIEQNEAKVELLRQSDLLFVQGNAEEESILLQAGLKRARGLIVTLPEDSANVFVTLTARELNPDLFILARTEKHQNRRKLERAGANKVIAPYEIGADRMAQVILRPQVDRFMEQVLKTGALDLKMEEVRVQPKSLLDGKSLAESKFRQRFDAIVVAQLEADSQKMNFNPDPKQKIKADDVLIVMGSQDMIERLRTEGCTA